MIARRNAPKALGFGIIIAAALALAPGQSAEAGRGASYGSLQRAIASRNHDSIVAEIERAEKLSCASCLGLVEPLIDHPDARVRDVAAWWLAKRPVRGRIAAAMVERLQHGDTVEARNAAEVLGRLMDPSAIAALEIALHDGGLGDEARVAAARSIGTIGDPRGKAVLEAGLTSESPAVRAAAAQALRFIRGNVDAVAVVELLGDEDDRVVQQAALTVGALREASALDGLLAVLTDPQRPEAVRKHAAWALGKLGDGAARDVLRDVSRDDPSMLVRGAARAAYNDLQ